MDALSAFISSKLAQGELVYLKMPKGVDTLASTDCLSLIHCIYGLCQSPRAFFMLTCEVYLKAQLKQLLSDKCVFVRFENNLIGGPVTLSSQDIIKNSREKWRKWISLTGSHCWPSASANHRQTG